MREIPVSVVVMTKNEERNIARCLRSVERFAEVFVVDSGSTDGTRRLAEAAGARVVDFEWDGKYPKKKQWCLERLPFAHDWVLYLDADEQLYPETASEIGETIAARAEHAGYFVEYDYVFLGRVLRHGARVQKLVLFDRRRGSFHDFPDLDASNMWEVEGHYQPVVEGTTGRLRSRVRHEDHDSLFHYFERHNRYSDWEAVVRGSGALASAAEALSPSRRRVKATFDRVPFKSLVAFLHAYFFRLGLLDGRAGFHYAVAKAFYYWQVELKLRERELAAAEPEAARRLESKEAL